MSEPGTDINSAGVQTYLGLLQGAVSRMANNSGACKSWCITVAAAVTAVTIDTGNAAVAYAAILPAIVFSLLDAYYLSLEKDYRGLYNEFVEDLRRGEVDQEDLFEMRMSPHDHESLKTILRAYTSVSVWPVYTAILVAALGTGSLVALR